MTAESGSAVFEAWEFWWENNSDRFLNLKRRGELLHESSGGPGFLTGRGSRNVTTTSRGMLLELTRTRTVPYLLEILDEAEDGDILASSLIALARTAEGNQRSAVLVHAERLLRHRELDVSATAALSIGILGTRRAASLLINVAQANSAGRRAVGGGKPADLVRAFAALGLGMLGSDQAVKALEQVVLSLGDREREVKASAITALGLIGSQHRLSHEVRGFLEAQLALRDLDDDLRAAAALSLGRLGRREAVPVLLDALTSRGTKNAVRRSAAIALGLLAELSDEPAVSALLEVVEDESDAPTRHFALIALGEIGARDTFPEQHGELHDRITRRLSQELSGRGRSKQHRSWAALASALYVRGQPSSQPQFALMLRDSFARERNPSLRGACALALGLIGDRDFAPAIHAQWLNMKDTSFRGYAALALGFLDASGTIEDLHAVMSDQGTPETLRRNTATALGLLRDRNASEALIKMMGQHGGPEIYASATRGLALLGSVNSLETLLELVGDERQQEQVRAFASVALGLAGERSSLPWNEPLRAHSNYLMSFTSLAEVRDLF